MSDSRIAIIRMWMSPRKQYRYARSFLADEALLVVRIAPRIARHLWVWTQGAGEARERFAARDDPVRRLPALDPAIDSGQHVELIRRAPPRAVRHARHDVQACPIS